MRSQDAGRLVLLGTWAWLATATCAGLVGLARVYREPERVAVDEFSVIYAAVGLGDQVMISVFLALPLAFAVFVGSVVVLRRGSDRGALVLATGLVALYFFVSGSAAGLDAPWLRHGIPSVAVVLVAVFLVAFPTGTFRPRWSVLVPIAAMVFVLIEPELAFDTRALLGSSGTRRLDGPLADVVAVDGDNDRLLAVAATVESDSEHPLARAIGRAAEERGEIPSASAFKAMSGRGVEAVVDGSTVLVGGPAVVTEKGVDTGALEDDTASWRERGAAVPSSSWTGKWREHSHSKTRSGPSRGRRSSFFMNSACGSA